MITPTTFTTKTDKYNNDTVYDNETDNSSVFNNGQTSTFTSSFRIVCIQEGGFSQDAVCGHSKLFPLVATSYFFASLASWVFALFVLSCCFD